MEFYATLGGSCADRATLDGLFAAGMTGGYFGACTPDMGDTPEKRHIYLICLNWQVPGEPTFRTFRKNPAICPCRRSRLPAQ